MKQPLEYHFEGARDLSALIGHLQRMKQLGNESPLTFITRLQAYFAKFWLKIANKV